MVEPKRKRTERSADSKAVKRNKKTESTLHRCRFVTQTPTAVNLIAVEPTPQQRLALVREDNTIEIRGALAQKWSRLNTFRSHTGNIQAVVWAKQLATKRSFEEEEEASDSESVAEEEETKTGRLFTGGADGQLHEWDVTRACILVTPFF